MKINIPPALKPLAILAAAGVMGLIVLQVANLIFDFL